LTCGIRLDKNELYHGQLVSTPIPPPSKLQFDLSSSTVVSIQKAINQFESLASKHDVKVVTYEAFGKSQIKKFGVSPDAFAQMAIQLAYFKMYGVSRATYESAGVRKYRHGRTETGRSVSVESVAWVKAMQDPDLSVS
jgi:carnitine O-acetyltransferase